MNLAANRFFGGKRKRSAQSRAVFLRRNGPIIMVYAFILLLVIIGITQSERFFTERNLTNVARQSAFLGIVALGQMLVILTAGIDLSVGSLVKVSILVSAIVMNGESSNVLPAIIATLGFGCPGRLDPRFLINELRIAPFHCHAGVFGHLARHRLDHLVLAGRQSQPRSHDVLRAEDRAPSDYRLDVLRCSSC